MVSTTHHCDDTVCNVDIEIRNFGDDQFEVTYEFSAYATSRDSNKDLVGELTGSYSVSSREWTTLTKQFPVLEEPNLFSIGTTSTRGT